MKDDGNNEVCTIYMQSKDWDWPTLQILRKHFGLEAFVMHENLDPSTFQYLKRNNGRYAYRTGPEKATLCYLVLPSRAAQWETRPDDDALSSGYYSGESGSSMLVDPSSLALTEEHQRRFAREVLQLALKPSVHPSQLTQEMSATSPIGNFSLLKKIPRSAPNKEVSEEEQARRDSATRKRISDLEQSKWPKLMLLSSQTYSEPWLLLTNTKLWLALLESKKAAFCSFETPMYGFLTGTMDCIAISSFHRLSFTHHRY
jgi:hypothetical protein